MTEDRYFLFLDYETTGEPNHDLLEVGWMLTDRLLEPLIECQSVAIKPPAIFTLSNETLTMHTENGLLADVAKFGVCCSEVEQRILASIQPAINSIHRITLAGFSCHYDRILMKQNMAQLDNRLHYRHHDVSVLRGTYSEWVEQIPKSKNRPHRAKDDVLASWEMAKTYKELFEAHMPKGLIARGLPL